MTATHAHHLRTALPLFLFAGLCLSSLDATAKYLVQGHSVFLVVWARYLGQMAVVTPFAWHRAGHGFWRTQHLKLQLARSLCLVTATVCFFSGLRYLPLAEGSAITFLAPMFVVALAWPVLHERPPRARIVASIVGFIGVLVLLRPGSDVLHPAVVLLIGAALSNALYQLLTRKLVKDSIHTTLFHSALVGAVMLTLAVPWALAETPPISLRDALPFVMLGVLAGVGHWSMTSAYLIAPAALLAPFAYLQILWAIAFGYAIFDQHPDGLSALGMAIVVASGVGLAAWERRRARVL
jgi:drug/metabolite transporter (DMT)-like permease